MPRFFVDSLIHDEFTLDGENASHAIRSLRMKKGEELTLCDGNKNDYVFTIADIQNDTLRLKLLEKKENISECPIKITLFQCLPKGDKMDLIVQKSVELGVCEIVPVMSSRCITKYNGKEDKKITRLNKICLEAAKQSGRGVIPLVQSPITFNESIENSKGLKILFYENGGEEFATIVSKTKNYSEISIFIGPEGGFSSEEVAFASNNDCIIASLGNRILRTETASLCALSIMTYEVEKLWRS